MPRSIPEAPLSTAENPVHVRPGYRQFHCQESSDGHGVLIFVKSPHPITDDESSACYKAAEDIMRATRMTAVLTDPEFGPDVQHRKEKLLACFPDQPIFAQEIPNEYGDPKRDPFYLQFPWYIVTTSIGHIKIGPRKRVISIDWSQTLVKAKAIHLFPTEDVTREGQLIHAWGLDKAAEYLKVLHSPSALEVPADGIATLSHPR